MKTNFKELLEAGVHFGHLKKKWNPKMSPYVFMEKNKIFTLVVQEKNKTVGIITMHDLIESRIL